VTGAQAAQSWPRAAIFDCDGLLVDSAHCWESAYGAVARACDRTLADVDLAALAGASVATAAARLTRDFGQHVNEAQLREALNESFASRPPAGRPGARQLITKLATRMPLAVASNAPRDLVMDVLERLGSKGTFDVVVSAEETGAHKPAPDVYLEACGRLCVAPCDAIAFEDSLIGARAATSAGLVVVGVPSAPGLRLDADLVVSRLDDPRLLSLLRVRSDHSLRRA
jgi:HAD superfamily hydrolase (TIGR01509 family)